MTLSNGSKLREVQMETATTCLEKGEALRKKWKWKEALPYYQKVVDLEPENWLAHHHLGDCLLSLENYESAILSYHRCLQLNSSFVWSHYNLAVTLFNLNRWQEASDCYKKVTSLNLSFWEKNTVDSKIQVDLGDYWAEQQNWEEAKSAYHRCTLLEPDNPQHYCNLGRVLYKSGSTEAAIASLRQAITVDPNFGWGYFYLGEIFLETEDLYQAVTAYQKSVQLLPDSYVVQLHMGKALEKNQQVNEAITCYRLAIERNFDDSEARQCLQALLEKSQNGFKVEEQDHIDQSLAELESESLNLDNTDKFQLKEWINRNSFLSTLYSMVRSPEIKVVSFDYFDTFVYRDVILPTSAFYMVGNRLKEKGILPPYMDARRFHDLRIPAEKNAREKLLASDISSPEVNIEEIYSQFPENFFGQYSHLVAAEVELEIENKIIHPYMPIVELAKLATQLGKEIIITSDTYFSASHLQFFLQKKLDLNFLKVYTSSDYRTGKGGNLFKVVLDELSLEPSQLLHIGDNYNADISVPSQLGIRTGFLPNGTSEFWINFNQEIQSGTSEVLDYIDPKVGDQGLTTLRAKILATNEAESNPYWSYGATVFGPIFWGFASWVLYMQSKLALDTSVYLMREGEFLSRLVAVVNQDTPSKNERSLIYISRRIVRQASIWQVDEACLKSFVAGRQTPSVQEVLGLLGLDVFDLGEYSYLIESSLSQDGIQDQLFNLILSNQRLCHKILTHARLKRAGLIAHLRSVLPSEAFDPHREKNYKVGVVDIGWNGSIQKYLNQILDKEGYKIQLFGFYLMTTGTVISLTLKGNKMYGFLVDSGRPLREQSWVMRTLEILEQSCTPPIGSLIDYDALGQPITANCMIPSRQIEQIASIQRGALDFCNLANLHIQAINYTDHYYALLRQILFRAVCRPSLHEVELFEGWSHDENLVQQSTETLVSSDLVKFISCMTPRQFLDVPMSEIYWPYAVATTQAPQTASLLRAISSGVIQLEEAESITPAKASLYFDVGQGFSSNHKVSVPIYRNIEGNTYIKLEVVHPSIQGLCFEPIHLPAIIKIHCIILTYWCDYSNHASRVILSGSQLGSVTMLRNMRPIGISTYNSNGNPKITLDFSRLKIQGVRQVKLEAGISFLLVDTPPDTLD